MSVIPDTQKISLVIPTLNEEGNLRLLLPSLPKGMHEVIIVDGYSSDKTVEIAQKFGAKVLYDKLGKGSALRKGMGVATGDVIIIMDADCSHISTEIPLLIAGISAGYDICMGSRFIQGGGSEDITPVRKWGNKILVWIVNLLWHMNYSDLCYGYRALRREVVPKLKLEENGFGIETEISIKAAKAKVRVLEVPSFEKLRYRGVGKLQVLRDGVKVLMCILKELFTK